MGSVAVKKEKKKGKKKRWGEGDLRKKKSPSETFPILLIMDMGNIHRKQIMECLIFFSLQ